MTKDDPLEKYKELFFKYHGPLVMFSIKFTGNLQSSQDIVQNAFIALWEKAESVISEDFAKSYLFHAVRNRSFNYIRDTKIHTSAEEELKMKFLETERNVYRDTNNPYHSLLELELTGKIKEIIDSLPPKCKHVYQLSRDECMKNQEIATMLDISIKMVEKHISTALRILRKNLSEYLTVVLWLVFF